MIHPRTNHRQRRQKLVLLSKEYQLRRVPLVPVQVVSLFVFLLLSISIQIISISSNIVFVSSFIIQQQQRQQQLNIRIQRNLPTQIFLTNKAGTFFNEIPESSKDDSDDDDDDDEYEKAERLKQSLLVSTSGIGFKNPKFNIIQKITTPNNSKSFVGIGPPLNDVTKPEYDENGYTLYADETTGKKSRVFEALVDYPCKFTLKIVGDGSSNSKLFVKDILLIVAQSCNVTITNNADNDNDDSIFNIIQHTTRTNGKWISITVQAPVENAEMLYQLYENIDRDPRVKFKF